MAKRISDDMRAVVIRHMEEGKEKKDIAEWLLICTRSVTRIWNKYQAAGDYKSSPNKGGRKPCVSDNEMSQIVEKIKEEPDMTLLELIEEFNLSISESALCRRLLKLDLTFKKRRSIQMNKNVMML